MSHPRSSRRSAPTRRRSAPMRRRSAPMRRRRRSGNSRSRTKRHKNASPRLNNSSLRKGRKRRRHTRGPRAPSPSPPRAPRSTTPRRLTIDEYVLVDDDGHAYTLGDLEEEEKGTREQRRQIALNHHATRTRYLVHPELIMINDPRDRRHGVTIYSWPPDVAAAEVEMIRIKEVVQQALYGLGDATAKKVRDAIERNLRSTAVAAVVPRKKPPKSARKRPGRGRASATARGIEHNLRSTAKRTKSSRKKGLGKSHNAKKKSTKKASASPSANKF